MLSSPVFLAENQGFALSGIDVITAKNVNNIPCPGTQIARTRIKPSQMHV